MLARRFWCPETQGGVGGERGLLIRLDGLCDLMTLSPDSKRGFSADVLIRYLTDLPAGSSTAKAARHR